jgi:hypothetical protein
MDIVNSSIAFITNTENSWILYSIGVFMVLDGIIMRVITKYLPNILPKEAKEKLSKSSLISLSANLTVITGILVIIITFYFSQT